MEQMPPARRFEEVGVWQKAHAWVLSVCKLTEQFPRHETYGLSSQLRRAAVSVPANFAEGFAKRSRLDKARFLNIAQGSLEEAKYYLILAHDLQYARTENIRIAGEEVSRMLRAYYQKLLAPNS